MIDALTPKLSYRLYKLRRHIGAFATRVGRAVWLLKPTVMLYIDESGSAEALTSTRPNVRALLRLLRKTYHVETYAFSHVVRPWRFVSYYHDRYATRRKHVWKFGRDLMGGGSDIERVITHAQAIDQASYCGIVVYSDGIFFSNMTEMESPEMWRFVGPKEQLNTLQGHSGIHWIACEDLISGKASLGLPR